MVFTFTRPSSEASSDESDDWNERYEDELVCRLWPVWYHRHLNSARILQNFVLITWRQLCYVDADIVHAICKQRLLRSAFATWKNYQWQLWRLRSRALDAFLK